MQKMDYNKNMTLVWYTESKEIEIVENQDDIKNRKWHFYFHGISELADLINTNPQLAKELKKLI